MVDGLVIGAAHHVVQARLYLLGPEVWQATGKPEFILKMAESNLFLISRMIPGM